MKHSVYLIDYENISYKGLFGIGSLKPDDEIIIFYSNSIAIIKDILSVYEKINIKIKYFCLEESGKNALDFMITTYIGYYASKNDTDRICVISKDKGYTSIKPVIDDINSNIELCFDTCIHNVIFPDKKTSIMPVRENEKEQTLVTEKQKIYDKRKEYLIKLIDDDKIIPEKYSNGIINLILKCSSEKSNNGEFISKLNNMLGNKEQNREYKEYAKRYYLKFKKNTGGI